MPSVKVVNGKQIVVEALDPGQRFKRFLAKPLLQMRYNREIILAILRRELASRFTGSVGGWLWAVAAPLFAYLDELNPLLWRGGKAFPQNYPAMKQLLADNEVDIIFAFNPSEASSAIANGELPDTVRSFTFPGGTLANTHFVAIPYNAAAKAGALVAADFLISPEAQARKQDPKIWGDPTVLAVSKLDAADRTRFDALDLGVATLKPDELGPALDEPHPSWMDRIETEWKRRYGAAN